MAAKKPRIEEYPPEATGEPIVTGADEYTRGIKKIASYSGVTRVMKCNGKCGKYDDIVNIYVYPSGIYEDVYDSPDNKVIGQFTGDNAISKKNVKNDNVAYRHKKGSKPVRRMTVPKRSKANKRK
jgi:hypothetical protein